MLSIFQTSTDTVTSISFTSYLLSLSCALIFGLVIAAVYMYKNRYSKSFVVTLALLPAMVQLVIMLVNGNLGAGVAVMGAFSLVRFRSIPGSAREIGSIFFAMAVGLATGMGYLALALAFLIVVGTATLLLQHFSFGEQRSADRDLKITIPENLDYEGLFDDVLAEYTSSAELISVKTTNMGSLFELQYRIRCKGNHVEKAFLDALRVRNGNLSISCGKLSQPLSEL